MFKTKLRKSDTLFSQYIKKRDKYTCQRCGKQPDPRGLHCSHYFRRSHENTRHDPENCIALCFWCHQLWGHGEEREQYTAFMRKKLGDKGFDLLQLRANTYKARDDKLDEIIIKELLKEV
jgi:5-methylcytosine-specific restriction endonuclease McrA